MDWHWDGNKLRTIIEADTEKERQRATQLTERGRVLTLILAFLGVITSPIFILNLPVAILTLISAITGITRVIKMECKDELGFEEDLQAGKPD